MVGKIIRNINIPHEFLITALRRGPEVLIPEPTTVIREKDVLTGVVKVANLAQVKERLGLQ